MADQAIYCKHCSIWLNGVEQKQDHDFGIKHRRSMRRWCQLSTILLLAHNLPPLPLRLLADFVLPHRHHLLDLKCIQVQCLFAVQRCHNKRRWKQFSTILLLRHELPGLALCALTEFMLPEPHRLLSQVKGVLGL